MKRLSLLWVSLAAALAPGGASAQFVPVRVDGHVDPAAVVALMPTGPAPGRAGTFSVPDVSSNVERREIRQSVSARTPHGPDALYVTLSVLTTYGPSAEPLAEPSGRPSTGETVDTFAVRGFVGVLRESANAAGADFLSVRVTSTRTVHVQGQAGSQDVLLETARAIDLAAFAALPATHTVWVDPVELELVDPAAPDLPVVVRSPTPRALYSALDAGPGGWRETANSVDVVPWDDETDAVASARAFLLVRRCFEQMTTAERAAYPVPTPAALQYGQFHPGSLRSFYGMDDPTPPRVRACLSLISVPDDQVDGLVEEIEAYEGVWRTDTLGGMPARLADGLGEQTAVAVRPGGLVVATRSDSLAVLDGLIRSLRIREVPAATDLVAFDRTPWYTDQVLWDGVFSTALAPGRLFVQSQHPYAPRVETAWPAGWTWTDPDERYQHLWLAEAGPVGPLSVDALHRAATRGLVLTFAGGARPDELLTASGQVDDRVLRQSPGLQPFLGWTIGGRAEPVEVAGSPAAVRLTLRGSIDGVALVAQVVDYVWEGVEAELVAVVSRPEEVERASAALAEALAQTTVTPF